MSQFDNICMGCMKSLDGDALCPHCGYNNNTTQNYPYLPYKTVLNEKYLVGRMMDHSSDCVLYMGYDLDQKAPVTIREFMPRNLASRIKGNNDIIVSPGRGKEYQECMQNFLELWRHLGKMRELSAIIPVYDLFEAHKTVFAVSEYIEYVTLRDYLLRTPEGNISWDKARTLFMPVLSTLTALHNNGIIHRAISSTNLVVCRDGKLRLTNFSIWQANTQGSCLLFQEQAGYFAIEQYSNDYQQGPWTDIYGFAATLYRALVGNNPIDALTRSVNDKLMIPGKYAEQIPAYVINAMGNALQIYPNDRTRTVENLRAQLSASPSEIMTNVAQNYQKQHPQNDSTEAAPTTEDAHVNDIAPRKSKKSAVLISVIILLGVIAIGAGVYFAVTSREPEPAPTTLAPVEQLAVPKLTEMTETEVRGNSSINNSFVIEFTYEFNDKIAVGVVMAQSLPASSTAPKGTKITVTVSKGVEKVQLSDYSGMDISEAKTKLQEAGFKVSIVSKDNYGSHTPNTVFDQTLSAGESYEKGTSIVLQVWSAVIVTTAETTTAAPTTPQ